MIIWNHNDNNGDLDRHHIDGDTRSSDIHGQASSPSLDITTTNATATGSKAPIAVGTELKRIESCALKETFVISSVAALSANDATISLKRDVNDVEDNDRGSNDCVDKSRQSIDELVDLLNGSKATTVNENGLDNIDNLINAPVMSSYSSSSSTSSSSSSPGSSVSTPPSVHLLDVSIQGTFDLLSSISPQHNLFGCYVSYHIKDSNDILSEEKSKRQLLWWDYECAVLNSSNRHRIQCACTSVDDVCTALGLLATQTYIEFTLHRCDEDGNLIDDTTIGDSNGAGAVLGKSLLPISDIFTLLNTSGSTTEYVLPIILSNLSSNTTRKDVMDRRNKHVMRLSVSHRIEPILLLNRSIDSSSELMTHQSSLPLQQQQQQQQQPSSLTSSAVSSSSPASFVNVSASSLLQPPLIHSTPSAVDDSREHLGFDLSMQDLEDIILSRKKVTANGRNYTGTNGAMWVPFVDHKEEDEKQSQVPTSLLNSSPSFSSSLMDVISPTSTDLLITLEEYAHLSIGLSKLNHPSVVCSIVTKINPDFEVVDIKATVYMI